MRQVPLLPSKAELREKMMAYAGIIRTGSELELLENWLSKYGERITREHVIGRMESFRKSNYCLCYKLRN